MIYFFILGSNPSISVAEIYAWFEKNNIQADFELINHEVLFVRCDFEFDYKKAMAELGGVIKLGIIKQEIKSLNQKALLEVSQEVTSKAQGKFNFGLSCYGEMKINIKKIALELKKVWRGQGLSVRWVFDKGVALSSASVANNKLCEKGLELILIKNNSKFFIGRTLLVQDFKDYSFRDYGRPARDSFSGMLPPKLARMMINLSQAKIEDKILDPFCGSGTIPGEAMLMGYKNIFASDISQKSIDDTKKNIFWVEDKYKLKSNIKIKVLDATKLSKEHKKDSLDAVVAEVFLGPQRGKVDLGQVVNSLNNLYKEVFLEFEKILKPGGRLVIALPVFVRGQNKMFLDNNIFKNFKSSFLFPKNIADEQKLKLSPRNTLLYGREGQRVWREILVLEK